MGLVALLGGVAACATVRGTVASFAVAPNGLQQSEDRLRRALSAGQFDSARSLAGKRELGAPTDRLLRNLYGGLVSYYAGDWAASAAAFERAEEMADDRLTRKLSNEAASLVTNDRALPWVPGATERLLARYYAMLARVRRDDLAGAQVEARRLVHLLQLQGDAGEPVERPARALMHYVAGAVFAAAGEVNDADVAWRNAAALGFAVPDSARRAKDDSATVLVLVEHGFVAHRVEQSLSLAFGAEDEFAGWASADAQRARAKRSEGRRDGDGNPIRSGADSIVDERNREKQREEKDGKRRLPRLPSLPGGLPGGGTVPRSGGIPGRGSAPAPGGGTTRPAKDEPAVRDKDGQPVIAPRPLPAPPVTGDGSAERREHRTVAAATDVGAMDRLFARVMSRDGDPWYVERDRWDRPAFYRTMDQASYVLTLAWPSYVRPEPGVRPAAVRALVADQRDVRGAPLYTASISDAVVGDFRRQRVAIFARAVARAATKYYLAEKAEEKKGWWAGMLANAAGDLLERADTRSWHLLPGEISVVRLRVPAGTHGVMVDVDGREPLSLGQLTLRPGQLAIRGARLWEGRLPRLAPATSAGARVGDSTPAGTLPRP